MGEHNMEGVRFFAPHDDETTPPDLGEGKGKRPPLKPAKLPPRRK
jgi:hypothetical protein